MKGLATVDYDHEGVRRVARVLLRHVRPINRTMAYDVLDGRLGVYVKDRTLIRAEVDRYFEAA